MEDEFYKKYIQLPRARKLYNKLVKVIGKSFPAGVIMVDLNNDEDDMIALEKYIDEGHHDQLDIENMAEKLNYSHPRPEEFLWLKIIEKLPPFQGYTPESFKVKIYEIIKEEEEKADLNIYDMVKDKEELEYKCNMISRLFQNKDFEEAFKTKLKEKCARELEKKQRKN